MKITVEKKGCLKYITTYIISVYNILSKMENNFLNKTKNGLFVNCHTFLDLYLK